MSVDEGSQNRVISNKMILRASENKIESRQQGRVLKMRTLNLQQ